MKLCRFGDAGKEKPGLIDDEGILRDLSPHVTDINPAVLNDLSAIKKLAPSSLAAVEGNPRLGPCVIGSGKFMCIGLNYADHAEESGMPLPPEPVLFMKATSAICGPYDPIIIPRGSVKTDWEVELGVVIGKAAKYVSESNAFDHIAGYCVINDVIDRLDIGIRQNHPGRGFNMRGEHKSGFFLTDRGNNLV